MTLSRIPEPELAERLRQPGILLRSGPLVMRLGTHLPEVASAIRLLYADFPLAVEGGIVDFEVRVDAPSWFRGLVLKQAVTRIDGQRAFGPFPRNVSLAMLEWGINCCVFTRPNQFLLLHSAVMERNGRGLLLSGKPGAGKSTLCAALVLRGWRLLSDEVAMVPPGRRILLPVPRPVGLKEQSIEIVKRFEPSAVIGPASPGTRKGTVAHLRPPADSIARCDEPATPTWVVFPRYQAGAPAELVPVTRTEAMLRVADEAFNYSLLGGVGFETLADVIGECECYEFVYGKLEEAVGVFDDLASRRSPVIEARSGERIR